MTGIEFPRRPSDSNHYIVGGQSRSLRKQAEGWRKLDTAVILNVDSTEGRVERCVEYVTPAIACADELPSITFKSSTLQGDLLYACTETEVIVYRVPTFTIERYISLPFFNDLHHVLPTRRGTLLLAVTGLDMVVELDGENRVIREWDTSERGIWTRFSKEVDYRKVATTKPHIAHPNFIFTTGDDVWVTRNEFLDAVCLTAPGRRITIWPQGNSDHIGPHDGHVSNGAVYFTTVDGHIVIADHATTRVLQHIDVTKLRQGTRKVGWCRGLKLLNDGQILVGFTRLRPTRFQDNIGWVKSRIKDLAGIADTPDSGVYVPTHIACIDPEQGRVDWTLNLEEQGLNAIFSIL